MDVMPAYDASPRPPSPWTGSAYEIRHRWQLDCATTLRDAAKVLRELAEELTAAHAAGWWLVEPMRGGHLLAARASRRQRAQRTPEHPNVPAPVEMAPPRPGRRLRLIQEPPTLDEVPFDAASAPRTPLLSWRTGALEQIGGRVLATDVLSEIASQLGSGDVAAGRWAVSTARVGTGLDLVADGSALRLHAVIDSTLVARGRSCPSSTPPTGPRTCARSQPPTGDSLRRPRPWRWPVAGSAAAMTVSCTSSTPRR